MKEVIFGNLIFIPLTPGFPRGVLSPSSIVELASAMRSSGVSALLLPLVGDDWKKIGEEEGTAPSPIKRLEARGVA
jgi:hypothetical protein